MVDSDYDELMQRSAEEIGLPSVAFNAIVINSKNKYGVHMFRLAEDPIYSIVNDQVVKALKDNKPDDGWGIVIEELEVK